MRDDLGKARKRLLGLLNIGMPSRREVMAEVYCRDLLSWQMLLRTEDAVDQLCAIQEEKAKKVERTDVDASKEKEEGITKETNSERNKY